MSDTGPSRAWEFLRRNPVYAEDRVRAGEPGPSDPAPFPLRRQTKSDLEAAAWGLLAWEDPPEGAGPAAPFWTEAPTLEARPAPEAPALAELLGVEGARLSGLRLLDGAAIVRVQRGEASVQIRIADGAGFDPAGGVDLLGLPPAADLSERLRRVTALWPIAEEETKKDAGRGSRTGSFFLRSTPTSPAGATA